MTQERDFLIPVGVTTFDLEDALFPPTVRVWPAANISLTNDTLTLITATSEDWDTHTMHDSDAGTADGTARLTAQVAGIYWCHAQGSFASNATGDRYLDILLNGTTRLAIERMAASTTGTRRIHVQSLVNMAVGDYVQFRALQNSGGALNLTGNDNSETYFEAVLVSSVP